MFDVPFKVNSKEQVLFINFRCSGWVGSAAFVSGKIPKNLKFLIFFTFGSKKISSVWVKKCRVGPLFTVVQNYAQVSSGPSNFFFDTTNHNIQGCLVVSRRNSIPATQVWLPHEETTEKRTDQKKCAWNELDWSDFCPGSSWVSHHWFGFGFGKFPKKISNFSIFFL